MRFVIFFFRVAEGHSVQDELRLLKTWGSVCFPESQPFPTARTRSERIRNGKKRSPTLEKSTSIFVSFFFYFTSGGGGIPATTAFYSPSISYPTSIYRSGFSSFWVTSSSFGTHDIPKSFETYYCSAEGNPFKKYCAADREKERNDNKISSRKVWAPRHFFNCFVCFTMITRNYFCRTRISGFYSFVRNPT